MINYTRIMILYTIIVLTASFMALSNSELPDHDESFNTYIDSFQVDCKKYAQDKTICDNRDVKVGILKIEDKGTLAYCTMYTDGSREIVVDSDTWEKHSSVKKEMIMYHELGHCLLDIDHKEQFTITPEGFLIPATLMVPHMFNEHIYMDYREMYMKDLFNP